MTCWAYIFLWYHLSNICTFRKPSFVMSFIQENQIFGWRGVFAFLRYLHPHFGPWSKSVPTEVKIDRWVYLITEFFMGWIWVEICLLKMLLFYVFSQLIMSKCWMCIIQLLKWVIPPRPLSQKSDSHFLLLSFSKPPARSRGPYLSPLILSTPQM